MEMLKMRNINVQFSVDVPDDATDEQIQEWLNFELGASGRMSMSNPCEGSIDADSFSVEFE